MRGRVAFILLASLALTTVPGGGSAAPAHSRPRLDEPNRSSAIRPTGCTHGGPPFRTHGPRRRKRIAIGFDDGPSAYTQKVLRVLRRFKSHATFFEIGQEVPGRAKVMKKVLKQGNEIGNHSLHHEPEPSSASLHETNRLIRRATGFRPCDFRPPDGSAGGGLIARAHAQHLVTVDWNVDPRDWARPGVGAIADNVIRNARNGSIVVMHDGGGDRSETVAALPAILAHFRHRGYRFVPVVELLGNRFIYPAGPPGLKAQGAHATGARP
jgi:peptidoglycan/xylan/chitin deacetylase (PgdA/CDA1 family)